MTRAQQPALLASSIGLIGLGSLTAQQAPPISSLGTGKLMHVSSICRAYGVRVFGFWTSQQRPQIAVNAGNGSMAESHVEIYRGVGPNGAQPKGEPILVLTPDERGNVVLPTLPSGKYYVLGRSNPDREDYLYLEISPDGRKKPGLVLNLQPVRGSAEWVFVSLRNVTHSTQVDALRGVVESFGRPVPNASIDVFVRKRGIDQQPIHLKANNKGEFSANLPAGHYAVDVQKGQSMFWLDVSTGVPSEGLLVQLCGEFSQ